MAGYNHYPSCTCEWCYKERNVIFTKINYSDKVTNAFPISKFSVTIPNAFCPVCGSHVFFYQNYYGSRVFFDELGPPWTKHPCTDNTQYSYNNKFKNVEIYSVEKNSIPKKIPKKNQIKVQANTNWKQIYLSELVNIYDLIYLIQGKEYLASDLISYMDFYFIHKLENGNILLSGYDVCEDRNVEIHLTSRNNSIEQGLGKHFYANENDIFFVKFVNDTLFETKVFTIDRKYQVFSMKINQFSEKTRRKILFNNGKRINKIKVKMNNNKIYEIT